MVLTTRQTQHKSVTMALFAICRHATVRNFCLTLPAVILGALPDGGIHQRVTPDSSRHLLTHRELCTRAGCAIRYNAKLVNSIMPASLKNVRLDITVQATGHHRWMKLGAVQSVRRGHLGLIWVQQITNNVTIHAQTNC